MRLCRDCLGHPEHSRKLKEIEMSNCYIILPKNRSERKNGGLVKTNGNHPVAVILSDSRKQLLYEGDFPKAELPDSWVLVYSDHEKFPKKDRLKLKEALYNLIKDTNPRIFHHGGEVNSGGQTGQTEVENNFKKAGFVDAGFSASNVRCYTEGGKHDWRLGSVKEKLGDSGAFKDIVADLDKAWKTVSDCFLQTKSPSGTEDANWLNGTRDDIDSVLNGSNDGMPEGVISRLMALFVDLSGHLADPEKLTGEDFKRAFKAYVASEKELSGWIGDLSRIRSAIERIDDTQQKKKLSDVVESGLLLLLSYKLFSEKFTEYHGLRKTE